jgi:hypothetical protein
MNALVKSSGPSVPVPHDANALVPVRALASQVLIADQSVLVATANIVGGYIVNPPTPKDQGLSTLTNLFVDLTGPAKTYPTNTTTLIQPGGFFNLPAAPQGVWVNSTATGHKFSAVVVKTQATIDGETTPLPIYQQGAFPPPGPTGRLSTIPSYLYQEYSMDDDLQAFVAAQNSMQNDIVDTFNGLNLPDYTQYPISGALLDWVAAGVYGMIRPSLSSGLYKLLGPYNTAEYNTIVYNARELLYPSQIVATNDDIFRRILTWHISKGDGKNFSIQWLKKRVMKFLIGDSGKNINIDQTYQISVTFGPNSNVTIRFVLGIRTITGSSMYNQNGFTYNSTLYNQLDSTYTALPNLPNMTTFAEAIASGVLELPFQFTYDVVIG